MTIDWGYPEPRKGIMGSWDKLVGPGATRAESGLTVFAAITGIVLVLVYQYVAALGWNILQIGLAALMAFDISGGVIANSTSAAKRWYHQEGKTFKDHFGFVAFHIIYPAIVAIFFLPLDWVYFLIVYGYLLLSAGIILGVDLHIRRPLSMLFFIGAWILNTYILTPIPGLEWVVPLLFLKLIMGHIVKEEPYRPTI